MTPGGTFFDQMAALGNPPTHISLFMTPWKILPFPLPFGYNPQKGFHMTFQATNEQIKQIITNAINASYPDRVLYFKTLPKFTPDEIAVEVKPYIRVDYYEGRMVKLTLIEQSPGTWQIISANHHEYQTWIHRYPTNEHLVNSVLLDHDPPNMIIFNATIDEVRKIFGNAIKHSYPFLNPIFADAFAVNIPDIEVGQSIKVNEYQNRSVQLEITKWAPGRWKVLNDDPNLHRAWLEHYGTTQDLLQSVIDSRKIRVFME